MKILFAASECVPFIKTGGLADVVGALTPVLKAQGADVRVILPLYAAIPQEYVNQMKLECEFEVELCWRRQYCGIKSLEYQGVTFYFVDTSMVWAATNTSVSASSTARSSTRLCILISSPMSSTATTGRPA